MAWIKLSCGFSWSFYCTLIQLPFLSISPFWCKFSSGNWKHKVSDDKFRCGGTWRRRKIDERSSNENRVELIQLKWICYGEELVILALDMNRLISSEFYHNDEINLVSISCLHQWTLNLFLLGVFKSWASASTDMIYNLFVTSHEKPEEWGMS